MGKKISEFRRLFLLITRIQGPGKGLLWGFSGVLILAVAVAMVLPFALRNRSDIPAWTASGTGDVPFSSGHHLRVMTLNLAHGRNDATSQLLVSKKEIMENLGQISGLINAMGLDVVALQEADGPSFWSGGFDHTRMLSEHSQLLNGVRGGHVMGPGLDYGSALLSRYPLVSGRSISFAPVPPTPPKGAVMARISIPEISSGFLTIISLHLDFISEAVRLRQVNHVIRALGPSPGPMIVMGDFNTVWSEGSAVDILANQYGLQAFDADKPDPGTFLLTGKRIDWILISQDLRFLDYQVLPDRVSDHRAVFAELEILKGDRR